MAEFDKFRESALKVPKNGNNSAIKSDLWFSVAAAVMKPCVAKGPMWIGKFGS